jgi:hypothetical protein
MSSAVVVRIPEVLPHTNADNLEIVPLDALGYRERQTITTKGQFKPGELGILITPGAQVMPNAAFSWLWKDSSPKTFNSLQKRLVIGTRRFRGQYSHALLMHPSELLLHDAIEEGKDVSHEVLVEHLEDDDYFIGFGDWGTPRCTRQHMPRSFKGWVKYLIHRWYA